MKRFWMIVLLTMLPQRADKRGKFVIPSEARNPS